MSAQTETGLETRLFVGGEFVDAEGGRTFENRDPYTDEVVSEVAAGGREDARRAVEAAAAAAAEWAHSPPAARQSVFLEAADVLESRQEQVVSMLARETGCTFGGVMTSQRAAADLRSISSWMRLAVSFSKRFAWTFFTAS